MQLLEHWESTVAGFKSLPLYFMKFHGATQVEQVLDTMDYAHYVFDVEHFVLDNLQFMMGTSGGMVNRFDVQDAAVEAFRKFATHKNVHITMVVHPRKQDDDEALNTASIFGSAKITQEADNVLILQKSSRGVKYLDLRKNRFSGDIGKIPILFNAQTCRYSQFVLPDMKDDVNLDIHVNDLNLNFFE